MFPPAKKSQPILVSSLSLIILVVHASIMMAGILYFPIIEFDRLKDFFFAATNRLPELYFSRYVKFIIRLSIICVPLLLIAIHGKVDRHPSRTEKYEVNS